MSGRDVAEARGARASRRGRLLVVDDDEINRAILENIFERHFEVLQAADGREAWRFFSPRRGPLPRCSWM